jgi:hypothetical protein
VPEELAAAASAAAADRPEGSLSPEALEKRWGRWDFMEKTWKKHGKNMGNSERLGKLGENIGNIWKYWKTMEKHWKTHGKSDEKTGKNHRKASRTRNGQI